MCVYGCKYYILQKLKIDVDLITFSIAFHFISSIQQTNKQKTTSASLCLYSVKYNTNTESTLHTSHTNENDHKKKCNYLLFNFVFMLSRYL